MWILRKLLHPMDDIEAIEFLIKQLKNNETNEIFFEAMKNSIKK